MSRYEDIISKRFNQLVGVVNTVEDLNEIHNLIEDNKGKFLFEGLAYSHLISLLGDEKSDFKSIALAYFIVAEAMDNPERRYEYYTVAADYFDGLVGESRLFVSAVRKREYALFLINLNEAINKEQFRRANNELLF